MLPVHAPPSPGTLTPSSARVKSRQHSVLPFAFWTSITTIMCTCESECCHSADLWLVLKYEAEQQHSAPQQTDMTCTSLLHNFLTFLDDEVSSVAVTDEA